MSLVIPLPRILAILLPQLYPWLVAVKNPELAFTPPLVFIELNAVLVTFTCPVLSTVKSVVVAVTVDEPMAKSVVLVEPLFA